MAQKNNRHSGGLGDDHCSFCGARRDDVEVMFQGMDGANICNKCIENGYKIIVDNELATKKAKGASFLRREDLLKPVQI